MVCLIKKYKNYFILHRINTPYYRLQIQNFHILLSEIIYLLTMLQGIMSKMSKLTIYGH